MKEHTKDQIQLRLLKLASKPICLFRVLRLKRLQIWLASFGVLMVVLVGCAHLLCTPAKDAANKVATWAYANCGCDEVALEAALDAECVRLGVCAQTDGATGPVANIACPILVNDVLVPLVASASFFQKYNCTKAENCVSIAAPAVIAACELIPVQPIQW